MNAKVGAWAKAEMNHAIDHWRRQYRGEAQVKDDTAVTREDIANCNLVLRRGWSCRVDTTCSSGASDITAGKYGKISC